MFGQLPWIVFVIQLITTLVEVVLGLRLVLRLFGASASAPFVNWIYETSGPLLVPFEGMFPTPALDGFFVLEFTTLFAIVAYSIAGYVLSQLIFLVDRTFTPDDNGGVKRK